MKHNMMMRGNAHSDAAAHDMDMQAGAGLAGNFAHKELVVLPMPVAVPHAFSTALGTFESSYQRLAAAFQQDDEAGAVTAAKAARAALTAIDAAGLSATAAAAWASHRRALETSLHQLQSAADIAGKRAHFSHASEALYCALRSFGGAPEQVHVAFCPMAFDGKGAYWLTREKSIVNPYFGKEMSQCGEIKETLGSHAP